MSVWSEQWEGRACHRCGAKRSILRIDYWYPPAPEMQWANEALRIRPAFTRPRAGCFDRVACEARKAKRQGRARLRGSRITLAEPPGSEEARSISGNCGWCGEPMYRTNKAGETVLDRRRGYHRAEHGERDCRAEVNRSYTFDARNAVIFIAKGAGETELRCVDCNVLAARLDDIGIRNGHDLTPWEADHELALEDGGEHVLENLRCRCVPCHRAKTAIENAVRAAARRPPSAQLAMIPATDAG